MIEQMARNGICFSFIDAIDAQHVDQRWLESHVDKRAVSRNLGMELTASEIACALSHRLAYEKIVHSGQLGAFVLEDDVTISEGFGEVVEYFSRVGRSFEGRPVVYHLGAFSMPAGGYLMLRQGTRQQVTKSVSFVEWLVVPKFLRQFSIELWGNFGYYITREAATAFLRQDRILTAADHWSLWARSVSGQVCISSPAVVMHPHTSEGSTLEAERIATKAHSRLTSYLKWVHGGLKARAIKYVLKPLVEFVFRGGARRSPARRENERS